MPNTSASDTSSSSYRDYESPSNNPHSRKSTLFSCLKRKKGRRRRNRSESFECEDSNAQTNYTDCEVHRPRLNRPEGSSNYGSRSPSPYPSSHCNGNNPGVSSSSPVISNTEPIILVKFERNGSSSFKREKRRSKCTILFNNSSSSNSTRNSSRRSSRRSSQRHPQRNQECQDCLLNSNPRASDGRLPQPHSSLLTSNGSILLNETTPFISTETNSSPIHSHPTNNSSNTTTTATPPETKGKLKRMRVVRSCKYGTRALQSRRRIIRMLIVIVVTFAVCNLPFHARKIWQNWSPNYRGGSTFSSIFTPSTFLIMYANSGINPLLYAFMSHKFRLSFRDLLCCKLRQSARVFRRTSARSAHLVPLTSTAI
ncbi:unnamed protein product [Allacma fusca]|uniref:G-protein coupled receptors family 1 profile domain-containing protein n=1 Tax=Allacma fusca TaxID=39272 RepID=A0A8J2JSW0_9HEXA|nr:unnamed protein product [Allacma fusca]